jgi:hypothetical protein
VPAAPARPLLLFGVAGNLTIVILWLVTRTSGIPLLGPHAGEVEEVGALDLFCTLAEVCVDFGLGALAMKDLVTESRIEVVVVLGVSANHGECTTQWPCQILSQRRPYIPNHEPL